MKNDANKAAQAGGHHGLVRLFAVIYDDDHGICCPMVWDDDCEGAICGRWGNRKIATFSSRKDARKAIDISAKFAALQRAQGKPNNSDFLGFRRFVKVVELHLPNADVEPPRERKDQ